MYIANNVPIAYKSNHNVVYACKYHVVWCPKYRRKVLVNGVDVRLKALIEEVCHEYRIDIIEMEIMPDHVHLLVEGIPSIWHPQGCEIDKGTDFSDFEAGVSLADYSATDTLD